MTHRPHRRQKRRQRRRDKKQDMKRSAISRRVRDMGDVVQDLAPVTLCQVSITYQEILHVQNGKLSVDSTNETVVVTASDRGFGFHSLFDAVSALNATIVQRNSVYIALLQIVIGPGQSWVMPSDKRNLVGEGCAYSSIPFTLEIGREETLIQNVRIFGSGQGASTIRGSFILDIWNVQNLGILDTTDNLISSFGEHFVGVAGGITQFDVRLLLQNFFLVGWFAINVRYSNAPEGMTAPNGVTGFDLYDPQKNSFVDSDSSNPTPKDKIDSWRQSRGVEVLLMNVWVQLSKPPLGLHGSSDEFLPVLPSFQLSLPLMSLNIPCMSRLFMSSCTFISYDMPKALSADSTAYGLPGTPPPLTQFSAQFLNTVGVTDTFLQSCSFSCREFGAPEPNFRSIQTWGHAKVSIVDCQFSGRCHLECNKVAAFGCYFLGTGIHPGEEETTHGLIMTPPQRYYDKTAARFGLPSGPRLIVSTCQFVCHTKKTFSSEEIQADLERLPFLYSEWEGPAIRESLSELGYPDGLNIQFDQTAFYMVSQKDPSDISKGFDFQPLSLTNFPAAVPLVTTGSGTKTL